MRLDSLTRPELIFSDLPGDDAASVLRAMAERVAAVSDVGDVETLHRRLLEREELASTGIGAGVAIPHCKMKRLDHVLLAVGTTRRAIDFQAIDGEPVRVFFLVASPEKQPAKHLKALAAISKWLKADHHVERLLELDGEDEIYSLLGEGDPE